MLTSQPEDALWSILASCLQTISVVVLFYSNALLHRIQATLLWTCSIFCCTPSKRGYPVLFLESGCWAWKIVLLVSVPQQSPQGRNRLTPVKQNIDKQTMGSQVFPMLCFSLTKTPSLSSMSCLHAQFFLCREAGTSSIPVKFAWHGCLLKDPKHLMNKGYNTEDVSRCIGRWILQITVALIPNWRLEPHMPHIKTCVIWKMVRIFGQRNLGPVLLEGSDCCRWARSLWQTNARVHVTTIYFTFACLTWLALWLIQTNSLELQLQLI